jgi:L-asparaginase II
MSNPSLIEVTRGPLVESVHRGAVCIAASSGRPLLTLGDCTRPVFVRSAIKLIQALPLVETGAANRFGFGNAEIALACGSHAGTARHVTVARGMLDRLGLAETCLACGAALPTGTKAAQALAASGRPPNAFHHMCSGKHAGMLASAIALDQAIESYTSPDHPVQRQVRQAVSDLSGTEIDMSNSGIDGCAVPTWALSLETLARTFAKIATGDGLPPERRKSVEQILAACWAEPELVAGPGRADTVVMAALPGRIYMKTGAEGVYCGAIPQLGIGFALKIDDGALRASGAAVMPLIEQLMPDAEGLVKRSILKTPKGIEVGLIQTSQAYSQALAGLKVA